MDVAWRILGGHQPTLLGGCAAFKTDFDPNLEQGGNTDVVVPPRVRLILSRVGGRFLSERLMEHWMNEAVPAPPLAARRVLVTCGAELTGVHPCACLLAAGHEVFCDYNLYTSRWATPARGPNHLLCQPGAP